MSNNIGLTVAVVAYLFVLIGIWRFLSYPLFDNVVAVVFG